MLPVTLTIVAPGIASGIRDAGRVGRAHLGAGRGGAVDLPALHLANRLLGNPVGWPALETSGGLSFRLERAAVLVVTGSQAAIEVRNGAPLGWGTPTVVGPGAVVRVGRLHQGARTYIGLRGGLMTTDGHASLRPGTRLVTGPEPSDPVSTVSAVPTPSDAEIVLWPGPRVDWLTQHARDVLTSCDWNVRAESDRIGLRLAGPALVRRPGELPSEGVVEGAVQLPPDGQPIVMLADHPTTGGYPVVAVVDPDHLWLVAQRPVGSVVRFRWHTGRPGR